MRGLKLGVLLLGSVLAGVPACGGGGGGADDDEDGGSGGRSGAGGATGGSSGSSGSSASGGTGGGTGGSSGGSGGATGGTGGASGKGGTGGGAGSGPAPCDTSDFEWEDPGCPADSLRTFGEPICANLYECIIGYGCAGLSCDTCIETASVGYAMNDFCVQGITAAELRQLCLDESLMYAEAYPECVSL